MEGESEAYQMGVAECELLAEGGHSGEAAELRTILGLMKQATGLILQAQQLEKQIRKVKDEREFFKLHRDTQNSLVAFIQAILEPSPPSPSSDPEMGKVPAGLRPG